jgi:hypothetical protein
MSLPQQIRPIFVRALDRLFFSPLGDFHVISGKQNFWNFPAAEFRGSRVLRGFQEPIAKAIIGG